MDKQEKYYQEIVEKVIGKGTEAYIAFLENCAVREPKDLHEQAAREEFILNWGQEYTPKNTQSVYVMLENHDNQAERFVWVFPSLEGVLNELQTYILDDEIESMSKVTFDILEELGKERPEVELDFGNTRVEVIRAEI